MAARPSNIGIKAIELYFPGQVTPYLPVSAAVSLCGSNQTL